jgi:hypothetical protein
MSYPYERTLDSLQGGGGIRVRLKNREGLNATWWGQEEELQVGVLGKELHLVQKICSEEGVATLALGSRLKQGGCKVGGQEEGPKVTSHAPKSARSENSANSVRE